MGKKSNNTSSRQSSSQEKTAPQQWLYGIQPVFEALKSKTRPIEKIWVSYGRSGTGLQRILALASQQKIPVSFKDRASLDQKAGTTKNQGVVALFSPVSTLELETFFKQLPVGANRFFAFLDEVQDPHNLGAVIRTGSAAGLEGILLPKHRASPITPVVVKASAGAVESVPIVRGGNAIYTMERIREAGILLIGADPQGGRAIYEEDLCQDICLVIGGEGKGLRPSLKKHCDALVSIPMVGPIGSLNVSVAAGIIFYEVVRQRREKALGK